MKINNDCNTIRKIIKIFWNLQFFTFTLKHKTHILAPLDLFTEAVQAL